MIRNFIEIDSNQVNADALYALTERMYPICRSITGEGVRETLRILQSVVPLQLHEVPTGTPAYDWLVPREWNIKDGYIKDAKGNKIVDFKNCNLHVLNYSIPVHKKVSLQELKEHCFTLPEHPDWIPHKTSYYKEAWGFCMAHNQFVSLPDEEYEVFIDSSLTDGSLSYGEYFIKGESEEEILIYSHTCHPSLCNDNLSGLAVSAYLASVLTDKPLKYSYRFVFGPATIGSITWLSQNEKILPNIKHALIITLVGDRGSFTYKRSRSGNVLIDRALLTALSDYGQPYEVIDFSPYGYDERQFCSPGINLDAGRVTRTPNGCYEEYHTSADNLDFISAESLFDSLQLCLDAINILETNESYLNLNPKCEPQLGKRGLFNRVSGSKHIGTNDLSTLWVLNLSDGLHSLLDITERSGLSYKDIHQAASALYDVELLASTRD